MPLKPETIAARGGKLIPSANRPLTAPIYQTSVYCFDDLHQVDEVWEGREAGFVYGRYGSPNSAMLEALLCELEGGEAALACASGMGAITSLCLAHFEPGDHMVAARDL